MVDNTIFNVDANGNWQQNNSADGTKFGYDRWFWQDDGSLGPPDQLPAGVTAADVAALKAWEPLFVSSHATGQNSGTASGDSAQHRGAVVLQAIANWEAANPASGGSSSMSTGLLIAAALAAAYFLFFNKKKK